MSQHIINTTFEHKIISSFQVEKCSNNSLVSIKFDDGGDLQQSNPDPYSYVELIDVDGDVNTMIGAELLSITLDDDTTRDEGPYGCGIQGQVQIDVESNSRALLDHLEKELSERGLATSDVEDQTEYGIMYSFFIDTYDVKEFNHVYKDIKSNKDNIHEEN